MADPNAELRERAVEIALEEVAKNVKESDGPNRGPEVDKYMRRANAPLTKSYNWCGMFVNYVFTEDAIQLGKSFPIPSGTMWSGPKLKRWAASHWDTVIWDLPLLPGDIYVMYRGHIGMVAGSYSMDDIFEGRIVTTIDGNQVVGADHNTEKVSLKKRKRDFAEMEYVIRI
jgi:hypothetical protein